MFDLIDRFFPEDDPKSLKRWRNTVGAASVVTLLGLLTLATAATTGIPLGGRLAWAGDVQQQVQQAVAPIEKKLEDVSKSVDKQAEATNAVLAKLASDQVDQLVKRRCKAKEADEIEYLSKEIRKYSAQYRELAKDDRYRPPTCEEIGYKTGS